MDRWFSWFGDNAALVTVLGVASALMFVGSLIAIPFLVTRLPADYFIDRSRHRSRLRRLNPAVYVMVIVLKNLLGIVLVLGGIAMLVLPGQGLLSILVGVLLTDFPGKFRFERWLFSRPGVYQAVNWVRKKAGKAPVIRP